MGGAIPQAVNTKFLGGIIMLNYEYNIVRNLTMTDLGNPAYQAILLEYAQKLAPPCVAEALMQRLNPQPPKKSSKVNPQRA